MITSRIIKDREQIEGIIPRCEELAQNSRCVLPFQYQRMSLIWWDCFNSMDCTPFEKKRGRNFLGAQSWLEAFYFIAVENNGLLCGAVPLVSWSVKIPGRQKKVRVLSFAGEPVLMAYQDFLLSAIERADALLCMLHRILDVLKDNHDVLFLGFIPDDSTNLSLIRSQKELFEGHQLSFSEYVTCRRGGVQPWTHGLHTDALRMLCEKLDHEHSAFPKVNKTYEELQSCHPQKLLFQGTRKAYEEKIHHVLKCLDREPSVEDEIHKLADLLGEKPIAYPFIDLPPNRDQYLKSLSQGAHRNFRRYKRKYEGQGGIFEKVRYKEISERDIDNLLELHKMRWGDRSSSLGGDALKFHKESCLRLAESGNLVLFFATNKDCRIAGLSCIDYGRRREAYLIGRNPGYTVNMVGRLLIMESIYDAIDNGFCQYDLGYGGDRYKGSFTNCHRQTRNFLVSKEGQGQILNDLFLSYECMRKVEMHQGGA